MDKYEYNLKFDQIKSLCSEENYEAAAEIADTVNWSKIRNVNALVKAGEVYEKVQRYEESRDILLMAYDRSPIGRMIIYRLAELAIKMNSLGEAEEYYREFVEIAPRDNLKYVLSYEIEKAKGAGYAELIPILEELKEQEYSEEWSYELAYLYHKAGMIEKCIEACDELILWFGDGPYVERALELKMLYQPLTKVQEEKYKSFRLAKKGVTVIEKEEMEKAGEYGHAAVNIPQVSLSPERFNTVNLQEEIVKGMQQIINATEKETVSDTMNNIKKIVGEVPYLHYLADEAEEESGQEHIETDEEIDGSLRINFKELLEEEADGQISLMVKDQQALDRQITGQMTIADVLGEWEKTRSAAEQALHAAEQKKLESAKARALHQAEGIMERLNDVIPALDAGVSPKELFETAHGIPADQETSVAEELPFMESSLMESLPIEPLPIGMPHMETTSVAIPSVEPVSVESEDLSGDNIEEKADRAEEDEPPKPRFTETYIGFEEVEIPGMSEITPEQQEEMKAVESDVDENVETECEAEDVITAETEDETESVITDETEDEAESVITAETEDETENVIADETEDETENVITDETEDVLKQPTIRIPDVTVVTPEPASSLASVAVPEEIPPVVSFEEELEKGISLRLGEEISEEGQNISESTCSCKAQLDVLSPEQKAVFSYFVPVKGMENQLCATLASTIDHLKNDDTAKTGNIIVQGGRGCGKTVLATSLIKVLQKETGKLMGRVGKISGDAINRKDIHSLLKKVENGVLIIERAGEMNRETAVKLSLLMQSDTSGILVILEDTTKGIKKALSLDDSFASRFTEKITVPIFTNDELVSFAKSYSEELGYEIEEMAVLALYNRISTIQKLDQATTLTEVKEIVDEAIEREAHGGLKKAFSILTAKRYSADDRIILREKDFE